MFSAAGTLRPEAGEDVKNASEQTWVSWEESGQTQRAHWRSETRAMAPQNLVPVDDSLSANTAFRLASEGHDLLWRGDFQNARQLLQALARRADRPARAHTPRVLSLIHI